jgi:hypothetical protein|tara:strand:+ start:637 stop:915 length:279 start_codon:yes stop_codon:yes gene_type:complete
MSECPEEFFTCLTEDEYWEIEDILEDSGMMYDINSHSVQAMGDAEAVANFTWQVLFLSPWELVYIALPMGVLAFYGLSIYASFKWIQRKFNG